MVSGAAEELPCRLRLLMMALSRLWQVIVVAGVIATGVGSARGALPR
ncbi:hypothetical protein ACFYR1_48335 [Streptomyces canus]